MIGPVKINSLILLSGVEEEDVRTDGFLTDD